MCKGDNFSYNAVLCGNREGSRNNNFVRWFIETWYHSYICLL